ncbi:unnamed protein product [Didymodactylos carnosus]|uniref:Uncharacterized protein n=1 Tax=Didymodactylos carnosus TaxID=1234261 RepID=A0A814YBK8_9BILA|nr:unnamed protein product [Didymodactylos carnosus]CAF1227011.1 unnamed protein product [Didymodactylos carnosus]CAF3545706.1 unnamed protein product [Didymodactylos carnosus]CAF3989934.1 unnamed protein product [Didymodactylos carnosus]
MLLDDLVVFNDPLSSVVVPPNVIPELQSKPSIPFSAIRNTSQSLIPVADLLAILSTSPIPSTCDVPSSTNNVFNIFSPRHTLVRKQAEGYYLDTANKKRKKYDEHLNNLAEQFKLRDCIGIPIHSVEPTNTGAKLLPCLIIAKEKKGDDVGFRLACQFGEKRNTYAFNCDPSIAYPPLHQPGPPYTVPRANLSEHLQCYQGQNHQKRWILFLPGSTEEVKELYSWNWMRIMDKNGWSYCTLQLPEKGLGDLQVAAEYITYAARKMYKKATREKEKGIRRKTRINIIGHSLGDALPRFSLRFWPDIRSMINHLIAFGPPNHGTFMADVACSVIPCPIAVTQQRINSSFLCALNSYQKTFSSIKYTNILSKFDELIRPITSSEINEKGVTNIYIQDFCPRRIFSEHLGAGIFDYCGYFLTMNALRSRSFKNLSTEECCAETLMPGINSSTTEFISKVAYLAKEHARHLLMYFGEVKDEPELRCPFRTDCIKRKRRVNKTKLR